MSRTGKPIEPESRVLVARGWGLTANGLGVSLVGGVKNVLKLILVMVA